MTLKSSEDNCALTANLGMTWFLNPFEGGGRANGEGSPGELVSAGAVSSQLFLDSHRVPSVSELG